jgi:hypothetical protein
VTKVERLQSKPQSQAKTAMRNKTDQHISDIVIVNASNAPVLKVHAEVVDAHATFLKVQVGPFGERLDLSSFPIGKVVWHGKGLAIGGHCR